MLIILRRIFFSLIFLEIVFTIRFFKIKIYSNIKINNTIRFLGAEMYVVHRRRLRILKKKSLKRVFFLKALNKVKCKLLLIQYLHYYSIK